MWGPLEAGSGLQLATSKEWALQSYNHEEPNFTNNLNEHETNSLPDPPERKPVTLILAHG